MPSCAALVDPFVSVVTVALNAAATIEDTLASVAQQRAGFAFEHVCVDGGSSDGTRVAIDRWAEQGRHVRRVYEPDHGISEAMNHGLRAARGEYVLYLHADDFLAGPETLATAMAALVPGAPDNPDLVAGDVVMGRPRRRGWWRRRRVPRLLLWLRGTGLFPVHQGLFVKRRLLEAAGGFDEGQQLGADVALYYDLERRWRPSLRLLGADVAFMRAGGAANASTRAMYRGTAELFRFLAARHTRVRAAAMVLVKTLQSLSELRFGRCPCDRWFDGTTADARQSPRARRAAGRR